MSNFERFFSISPVYVWYVWFDVFTDKEKELTETKTNIADERMSFVMI